MRRNLKIKSAFLAIGLFVYSSMQTSAQVIDCKQADQVTASIDRISSALANVGTAVEPVPPKEAEHLKNEARKSLEQDDKTKSDDVVSSRFYFPLKFHDNFDIAVGNLRAAKDASLSKDRARHLVVVLLRLADVASDMEGYIEFDLKRSPAMLNDDTQIAMRSGLQSARAQATSLLQCIMNQL